MLRRHHEVVTATSIRQTYLSCLCKRLIGMKIKPTNLKRYNDVPTGTYVQPINVKCRRDDTTGT